MMVSYCRQCLHDSSEKVVIAYGERRSDIDVPHEIHQTPPIRNGLFAISFKGWKNVFVDGNDAQTKANIIAQYGDEFEGPPVPVVIPDP